MRLVDEARQWWRLWSVQLAALAATIAAVITAQPVLLLGLLEYLPDRLRLFIVPLVWIVVFAVPLAVRLAPQRKLRDGSDGDAG